MKESILLTGGTGFLGAVSRAGLLHSTGLLRCVLIRLIRIDRMHFAE